MKFEVLKGPEKGKIYTCEDDREIVIGRDRSCAVCVRDTELSRCHARVFVSGDQVTVKDLNSTNGTFLNGKPIVEAVLPDGGEILVGGTLLKARGLFASPAVPTTSLRLEDHKASVIASVNYRKADLLAGKKAPPSEANLLRENEVLRKICEICQVVATERDIEKAVISILDETKACTKADTIGILLQHAAEEEWALHATSSDASRDTALRVSQTIITEATRDGHAVLSADAQADERFSKSESIQGLQIASAVCAPFKIDNRFCGVLVLDRYNGRGPFTEMDLRFAATVANVVGLLIEKDKYEAEVREQARLAFIGSVVAGLAHYAKNIITGLRFSIHSINKAVRTQRYDRLGSNLKTLNSAERRLTDLILDMLSYAKDREPQRREIDIEQLIEEVARPYGDLVEEKGIQFTLETSPNLPHIHGDETSLHRVFLNLFLNAVDALDAQPEGKERTLLVSLTPTAGVQGADVCFHDNGCGIPEEKMATIFDVFYSTKGSQGTGLGLAVVKKIITEHGGEISVDSREGEWTEFRITLPAVAAD